MMNLVILLSSIATCVLLLSTACGHSIKKRYAWHEEVDLYWAEGCDWSGDDISNAQIPGEQCGPECGRNSECTHFTWTEYNGGTCWLKRASVGQDQATAFQDGSSICGLMKSQTAPAASFDWHEESNLFWAENCDWAGNDIGNVQVPGNQCGPECAKNSACTRFTWTRYNGGTCWLKSGSASKDQATRYGDDYSVCGLMKSQVDPPQPGQPGCPSGWGVFKQFDFSNMDKVNQEWTIFKGKAWNNELQVYTDNARNVFTRNGHLILKAYKDGNSITSGRLHSRQTFSPFDVPSRKLRIEYTGKVPTVPGAWPAYWMNGVTETYGEWPATGEIDVMEWVQSISGKSAATIHWLGSGSHKEAQRTFPVSSGDMKSKFITYGVEYSAVPNDEYIHYYMIRDGQITYAQKITRSTWDNFSKCPNGFKPNSFPCSTLAPFDNHMTLIVNLAVGGDWGGQGVTDYSAFNNGVEFETTALTVCKKL